MSKVHVLVVDEDQDHAAWIATHLTDEGHEVSVRHTGDDAFYFMFQNPTTPLIVMSSGLEDISAKDLITKIEDAMGVPHIIILDKSLTPKKALELMKAGAADVVKCPFHELELKIAVQQAFEARMGIEQLNRTMANNVAYEIESRIQSFKKFLKEKKDKGDVVKPSEIALYFPGHDPNIDLRDQEIVEAIESRTVIKKLGKWPKPVVLTVDDEVGVLQSVTMALGSEYTVIKAESGFDAYEIIKAKNPEIDLVVLDIGMPKKSGDKWVTDFRQLDPHVAIVMLTAYKKDIDLIVRTIRAGANDFLTKPFLSAELLKKISRVMQRKLIDQYLTKWVGAKHFRIPTVPDSDLIT